MRKMGEERKANRKARQRRTRRGVRGADWRVRGGTGVALRTSAASISTRTGGVLLPLCVAHSGVNSTSVILIEACCMWLAREQVASARKSAPTSPSSPSTQAAACAQAAREQGPR